MAKLNLNRPIVDEMGDPIKKPNSKGELIVDDTTLAKALGGIMIKSVSTVEADILKFFTWASELGKTGIIDIDEGDSKTIRDFVVNNADVFVIIKAPVLKAIDNLKFK